jgi:hypothetical protein
LNPQPCPLRTLRRRFRCPALPCPLLLNGKADLSGEMALRTQAREANSYSAHSRISTLSRINRTKAGRRISFSCQSWCPIELRVTFCAQGVMAPPVGVSVSIASVSYRNFTPAAFRSSSTVIRSHKLRLSRSSFHTLIVSRVPVSSKVVGRDAGVAVFHALDFALDICNTQGPVFTALPAVMQNLQL